MSDILVEFVETPTVNVQIVENIINVEFSNSQGPAGINGAATLESTEW